MKNDLQIAKEIELKPITEIVLRKEYTFQFHKGTIKTHGLCRYSNGMRISIP